MGTINIISQHIKHSFIWKSQLRDHASFSYVHIPKKIMYVRMTWFRRHRNELFLHSLRYGVRSSVRYYSNTRRYACIYVHSLSPFSCCYFFRVTQWTLFVYEIRVMRSIWRKLKEPFFVEQYRVVFPIPGTFYLFGRARCTWVYIVLIVARPIGTVFVIYL